MQNQSWYAGIIYKNKKKKRGRKVSASIHHIQICILRTDKKTQGIQEKRATFTQLIEYNRLTFLVFVYIGTTPSTPQYPHKSKNSFSSSWGNCRWVMFQCQNAASARLNIVMVVHLNRIGLANPRRYLVHYLQHLWPSHHLKKNCMLIFTIQAASNHIKENQLQLVYSVTGSFFYF